MANVFEASEILKKEEASQTNFERYILRSIHWFANAQTPMQPEYILLSLMSSIEAFLNPPDHEKVTTAIIEGVTALGGRQGYIFRKKGLRNFTTNEVRFRMVIVPILWREIFLSLEQSHFISYTKCYRAQMSLLHKSNYLITLRNSERK